MPPIRSITLQLGKDPSTIAKEIKKHGTLHEHNRFNEPKNNIPLIYGVYEQDDHSLFIIKEYLQTPGKSRG